jgi:SAM-dependent methyltransferase
LSPLLYEYEGSIYPDLLRDGNACRFILPMAAHFCKGEGVDIGCGDWPLPGAIPIDVKHGGDAMHLGHRNLDFCFSSHALEHLVDPVGALEHWRDSLKPGGVCFTYLPHPSMRYWQPTRNRRHLHIWAPEQMAGMFKDLGFVDVLHSERDLAWGFACVGFKPPAGPALL